MGFAGDRYYRPMQVQGDWKPYSGSVMAIDPSGRGADETAYAVAKTHHGQILITAAGGLPGGYEEGTLQRLADIAKEQKVNKIIIESNFGDGMFTKLLTPYVTKTYPVTLEEVRHSTQKERRIIDTLEPVMNQHRLIVDYGVLMDDYESTKGKPQEMALKYTLAYQMTRITKDRGALKHDDRLDVLAMAVQYWVDHMAQDRDKAISRAREQAFRDELEKKQVLEPKKTELIGHGAKFCTRLEVPKDIESFRMGISPPKLEEVRHAWVVWSLSFISRLFVCSSTRDSNRSIQWDRRMIAMKD